MQNDHDPMARQAETELQSSEPADPSPTARQAQQAAIKAALPPIGGEECVYCGDPTDELVCDHCDSRIRREREAAEQREREQHEAQRESWFWNRMPDHYRETERSRMPQWALDLEAAWNPQDRYGATIHAPSDHHKTRAGILLLRKAYLAGRRVEYHQTGDLRRRVNRLAREGRDADLLETLQAVDVLMLDDFGNQAWTATIEEFWLALLERRAGNRPTIVTSQFPAADLMQQMTNSRVAMAIARRLGPQYAWIADGKAEEIRTPEHNPHPTDR